MSWRRFLILIGGLGPNSLYVNLERDEIITDPIEAERAVERVWI